MEVCVFGAGSLGSALGGILAVRHEVTLVGREKNMYAVRNHGLQLVGDVTRQVDVDALGTITALEAPELLIISTKAYDTRSAIRECRKLVDDGTKVLTLQNGLGNLELLREWRGRKAFGGTTTMGATLVSPGIVRVSGLGRTIIGADLDGAGAREIATAFRSCGLSVEVKRNVIGEIWGKAVISACINPTAAILRVANGKLLESRTVSQFMREVSRECEAVAHASGIALPNKHMYSQVRAVVENTARNISSMLQDVEKGKRTEIAQISGAFCSVGQKTGVPTPLNEALLAMVCSLETLSRKEKG